MQHVDETNIDELLPNTDDKSRLNKQAALGLLGAFLLSTTLWVENWQSVPLLVVAIGLALFVTPGLAFDGLLFGAMKRPIGSTIGNMLMSGLAWYAGSISLMFAFGMSFDVNKIAGATLIASLVSIVVTVLTGGAKAVNLINKADLKYVGTFAIAIVGMIALAAGSASVFINKDILQPAGSLSAMSVVSPEAYAKDNKLVLNGNNGSIKINISSDTATSNSLLVTFIGEDGQITNLTEEVKTTSSFKSINVNTPTVNGCGYITINNKTSGQSISRLYVKDYKETECGATPSVEIFKQFGIDMNGAPTNSLKDLLNYLQEQAAKGALDSLPEAYRACIQNDDPEAVADCVDSL